MDLNVRDLIAQARGLIEGGVHDSRLLPRYPGVAVEISRGRITAVRIARDRRTGRNVLRGVQSRTLPDGAIVPSLTGVNVKDPGAAGLVISEVLDALKANEHRISLLLPDHVARVSLLQFATLPRSRKELADLVRFRMAKSLPFKPDDTALDLQVVSAPSGPGEAGASTVLSTFIKRSVLQQYESLFTAAGFWPGLVGLSTFELFNLFRGQLEAESPAGKDVMLLNVTLSFASTVIFSQGSLIFYRCKPHPENSTADERVVALKREVYTSLAFYQEKLFGRGIGQVFLRVVGLPKEAVHAAVTTEVKCDGRWLDLREVVSLGAGVELADQEAAWACPASGAAAGRRP
ncbi:MAG TPA: hypothetical protein VFG08_08450 [Candidatus Polarisedimenticolia bacterium]|nr:hypothetical protein [Candidatus Polarisedimenticolia bacterium]